MTFARVKGRPTDAQRRVLMLVEQHPGWGASTVRAVTRAKLLALGLVELRCRHCHTVPATDERLPALELVLTERGRKYLTNWRKAYGAGAWT